MTPEQEQQPNPLTLEEVVRLAKEATLAYGQHVPTVIANGTRRTVAAQLMDFPDTHEDKMQLMFAAGYALGESGQMGILTEVFFISEGWWSQAEPDQPLAVRPSQDPKRKEVLLIFHHKVEGRETQGVVLEMIRNTDGKLNALRELATSFHDKETQVHSPLVAAFVAGFRMGMGGEVN